MSTWGWLTTTEGPSSLLGAGSWRRINRDNQVTIFNLTNQSASNASGPAKSGTSFMRFVSQVDGGSIGIDLPVTGGGSNTPIPLQSRVSLADSLTALAYVRSGSPTARARGVFKIWSLGLETEVVNNNGVQFDVGNEWTLIMGVLATCAYAHRTTQQTWSPQKRIEFYSSTPHVPIDIDSVTLF
jgi:hypothetical protein